jgi:DUF4097 and DUF4098 domain-containing protein YvlB
MYEFPCTGPIATDVQVTSGVLHVTAEQRNTVEVTVVPAKDNENGRAAVENTQVEMAGNTLRISSPTNRGFGFMRRGGDIIVTVRVPLDSALDVRSASADLTFEGRYATARVKCASSDMRLEYVSDEVSYDSASGDSEIGFVGGDASLQSASGDIRVASVGGDLQARSASGDINVGSVGGSATIHTASGDVKIGSLGSGEAQINTASGDVRVGVAEGTAVWLDLNTLSGDSRSDLAVSDAAPSGVSPTLSLHARTTSGDITVTRAPRVNTFQDAPVAQDLTMQD